MVQDVSVRGPSSAAYIAMKIHGPKHPVPLLFFNAMRS